MTIDRLKTILANGEFHHATYRTDFARGLHIYSIAKAGDLGFRGFKYEGGFGDFDPLVLAYAYHLTRNTGISLNAYGRG